MDLFLSWMKQSGQLECFVVSGDRSFFDTLRYTPADLPLSLNSLFLAFEASRIVDKLDVLLYALGPQDHLPVMVASNDGRVLSGMVSSGSLGRAPTADAANPRDQTTIRLILTLTES